MKISIIVPVYNGEKYLHKCMNSLVNQTYKDLEIICVNGNSTDQSQNILEEYAAEDERIRILNIENAGVSVSRNQGLDAAQGDYVMFVDADDWVDEETCKEALDTGEKEKADIVMWSYMREFSGSSQPKNIFDEERKVFEGQEVKEQLHRRFIGLVDKELRYVENADALCPVWGKLYRRTLIEAEKVRFWDIREIGTYEDGLFNLEVFRFATKAVYVQRHYYHYRKDNSSSITSRYKKNLYLQWQYLFKIMENYIERNHLPEIYKEALRNRICLSVLGQGLNLMESRDSFFKKYRILKEMLNSPLYRSAFSHFTLKEFPIHWKCFYGCAKRRWSLGVYALLKCIKRMIGS